ncbi:MAG: outer-membrane lipoprotein carrier protein LolA [Pseudomonadota bacterium]
MIIVFIAVAPFSSGSTVGQGLMPNSFTAKFEQVYQSALTGRENRSQGTLEYLYPGNIRFEIQRPDALVFTSNSQKSWYYKPPFIEKESGELIIKSSGDMVLNRFFDSLRKGLQSNSDYQVKQESGIYHLTFKEKLAQASGVKEAFLNFKEGKKNKFSQMESIELKKEDGTKVKFILSEIIENPKITVDRFIFTPPPNTKVTE